MKEDRLIPVVTLVIYFDAKAWDGPMSVHEMFETRDEAILSFVPDYKINLIAPAAIPDEDFDKFSTTLKEVLSFIKYSGDADKLVELVNSDEGFRKLGRKEVDILNSCVSAKLAMDENEEVLNVCEAIRTLERRAAEKATEKATMDTLLSSIKNLMVNVVFSVEQSLNALGVSEKEREILKQKL